jgi:hypothetical protein
MLAVVLAAAWPALHLSGPVAWPVARFASPVMQMRDAAARAAAREQRNSPQSGRVAPTNPGGPQQVAPPQAPPQQVPPQWRRQTRPSQVVQGGSLRTHPNYRPEPTQLNLGTDGRPLDAQVEVWQGPGYTPRRISVYSEDGYRRPFRSAETSRGPNTMAIRNTGPLEFPIRFSRINDPFSPYATPHSPHISENKFPTTLFPTCCDPISPICRKIMFFYQRGRVA